MHIRIVSEWNDISSTIAARLKEDGIQTDTRTAETAVFELRHKPTVPASEMTRLLDILRPLSPHPVARDDLENCDAELHLGDPHPLDHWDLSLHTDSPSLARDLEKQFDELGFSETGTTCVIPETDTLRYGGASPFVRQLIQWCLHQRGICVTEEKAWSPEDSDIYVIFGDPSERLKPFSQRFPIRIHCDIREVGSRLAGKLRKAGFETVSHHLLDEQLATCIPLGIMPGPFCAEAAATELARLRVAVSNLVAGRKIDASRYPLVVGEESLPDFWPHSWISMFPGLLDCPFPIEPLTAYIFLPLQACRKGAKQPYAGAYPERFPIVIQTDSAAAVRSLRARFEKAGFSQLEIRTGDTLTEEIVDFGIEWGAAAREPAIAWVIEQAVDEEMRAIGAVPPFTLSPQDSLSEEDPSVRISFPTRGIADGSLWKKRSSPERFDFTLWSPDLRAWTPLFATFEEWGFRRCAREACTHTEPLIAYGGAPSALLERVQQFVAEKTGLTPELEQRWSPDDDDIWLYLPAPEGDPLGGDAHAESAALDLPPWPDDARSPVDRPFVEVAPDSIRVGNTRLPRHPSTHPLAPAPALFAHYCLDDMTAKTLEHVAVSVLMNEPCLLEGETSTSKTSSILYLASLLNQPVVRLNLNGQTDTGDLIGRYAPQHLITSLPIDPAELADSQDLLESESRLILNRAQEASRPLTPVEIQQIMKNEGMHTHPWRWQDGMVVQAMKKGWWVMLDEMNLAEPQILERLNSALEPVPSLTLIEHDNSVIGPGGHPVHPDFRLFATMNPAEYAGRAPLSPAYRDRWRGCRFVTQPGEVQYRAMLRFLIYGQQPDITVRGRTYAGARVAPAFGSLTGLACVDGLIEALARFHTAVEHALRRSAGPQPRLGSRRRDPYTFTRRSLLSLLEYLCGPLGIAASPSADRSIRAALLRYYLERIPAAQDRQAIVEQLDAHGIGPHTWSLQT